MVLFLFFGAFLARDPLWQMVLSKQPTSSYVLSLYSTEKLFSRHPLVSLNMKFNLFRNITGPVAMNWIRSKFDAFSVGWYASEEKIQNCGSLVLDGRYIISLILKVIV